MCQLFNFQMLSDLANLFQRSPLATHKKGGKLGTEN